MAVLQFRHLRGTTAKVDVYTGQAGELVVDTTKNQICIQDGVTAGGIKVANAVDATQSEHGLMSAVDKQRLDVLYTQVASLVTQVETLADKLNTLIAKMDTYYSGYTGYPRS